MFVPLTPGSVLKGRIQERIAGGQLRIKLVEFSGPKIIDVVKQKVKGGQKEDRCGKEDCLVCNGDNPGRCRQRGIVYEISCKTCAKEGIKSVYIGESGNCCYQRGRQHLQDFRSNNVETRAKSVLRKHVEAVHGGNEDGIEFVMKPTDVFKNDPQGRQIMEGVKMREMKVDNIMNSRDEFHQPGEIIPILEGAGRRNGNYSHNHLNNNSQAYNSYNSNRSSQEKENPGDNSQGEREVTRSTRSDRVRSGGGVTTRARARRENLVV